MNITPEQKGIKRLTKELNDVKEENYISKKFKHLLKRNEEKKCITLFELRLNNLLWLR